MQRSSWLVCVAVLLLAVGFSAAIPSGPSGSKGFKPPSKCYSDSEKFEQLIPTRFTFKGIDIAQWTSLGVEAGAVSQVGTSCLATPMSGGFNVSNPVYLLTEDVVYLYHPNSNTLRDTFTVKQGSSSRLFVLPQKSSPNGCTEEQVYIAGPTGIQFCKASSTSASCTTASANIGSVSGFGCSVEGDICLIAGEQGIFSYTTLEGLTPLHIENTTIEGDYLAVNVYGTNVKDPNLRATFSTTNHFFHFSNGSWRKDWTWGISDYNITSIAFTADGVGYYGDPDCVSQQLVDNTINRIDRVRGLPTNNTQTLTAATFPVGAPFLWIGTSHGIIRYDARAPLNWPRDRSTAQEPTVVHSGIPIRELPFRYFYGPRWQPSMNADPSNGDNSVTSISSSSDGQTVWALSPKGLTAINSKYITLAEKAQHYQEILEARHIRYGLMSDISLSRFGDLSTYEKVSSDNDGLWTSINLAAQTFRFATTGSSDAQKTAWTAFSGLNMLNNLTGIDGLMGRSLLPVGSRIPGGTWHNSTVDPRFMWKGDTSSDEVTGHLFVYPIVMNLLAQNAEEKKRPTELFNNIVTYIVKNGFYLIDITGKPTSWGVWAPEKLNDVKFWYDERGLNSLQILSFIKSAYDQSGNTFYLDAFNELVNKYDYDGNLINLKIDTPDDNNFSDDELLFLPVHGWQFGEIVGKKADKSMDPKVAALEQMLNQAADAAFDLGVTRSWDIVKVYRPALWHFIYYTRHYLNGEIDDAYLNTMGDAMWYLWRYPWEQINWPFHNSNRQDTVRSPYNGRNGDQEDTTAYPPDERNSHRWNADPFEMDGGSGKSEVDPGAFLLPYWMGRFYGFIC